MASNIVSQESAEKTADLRIAVCVTALEFVDRWKDMWDPAPANHLASSTCEGKVTVMPSVQSHAWLADMVGHVDGRGLLLAFETRLAHQREGSFYLSLPILLYMAMSEHQKVSWNEASPLHPLWSLQDVTAMLWQSSGAMQSDIERLLRQHASIADCTTSRYSDDLYQRSPEWGMKAAVRYMPIVQELVHLMNAGDGYATYAPVKASAARSG